MRLCSYTMVHDYGFAPNPFWGFCTLGVCTPNHQGIKLSKGDWILGNSSVKTGNRLIYAMQISEFLDFDAYYRDARFRSKRPRFDRTWKEACGDNIYFRSPNGEWRQAQTQFHEDESIRETDLRHPTVFVSEEFYYFGENMVVLPDQFKPLIKTGKGCACHHSKELVTAFIAWLRKKYEAGVHGNPRHLDDEDAEPIEADRRGSCR